MNTFKTISLGFLFVVGLQACNTQERKQKELSNRVMKVHDEVMPEMGTLFDLSESLTHRLDAIQRLVAADSSEFSNHETQVASIKALKRGLENASEAMMAWMRQYKTREKGTPHAEVMGYLNEQLDKITQVKAEMREAKRMAEAYLQHQ